MGCLVVGSRVGSFVVGRLVGSDVAGSLVGSLVVGNLVGCEVVGAEVTIVAHESNFCKGCSRNMTKKFRQNVS